MKKRKFSLSDDVVSIESEEQNIVIAQSNSNNITKNEENVLMTLRVKKEFRNEYKSWCARKNMNMSQAIQESFPLLKEKYGF